MEQTNKSKTKRNFFGTVVSKAGDKTIVVAVKREKLHPKYLKRYAVTKKYKVHDPQNQYNVGDEINFIECRPLSKDKRWIVAHQK